LLAIKHHLARAYVSVFNCNFSVVRMLLSFNYCSRSSSFVQLAYQIHIAPELLSLPWGAKHNSCNRVKWAKNERRNGYSYM